MEVHTLHVQELSVPRAKIYFTCSFFLSNGKMVVINQLFLDKLNRRVLWGKFYVSFGDEIGVFLLLQHRPRIRKMLGQSGIANVDQWLPNVCPTFIFSRYFCNLLIFLKFLEMDPNHLKYYKHRANSGPFLYINMGTLFTSNDQLSTQNFHYCALLIGEVDIEA